MIDFNCSMSKSLLSFNFKGRLDTENTHKIAGVVEEKINNYCQQESKEITKIVFDIKEVDYIASAFIRTCIKAAQAVGKDNFALINSTPMIKKTFKVAGLDRDLNVS